MRKFCYTFEIDGKPILAPDNDMAISKSDLDSEDTGRDESGVMHRDVLRERVRQWELKYLSLDYDEFEYMNELFEGKNEFDFEIKMPSKIIKTRAYCSAVSANLSDVVKWKYRNISFKIVEC